MLGPSPACTALNTRASVLQGWNVSLFHYRSHGDDFGRVLVGVVVLPEEEEHFDAFLRELGYEFHPEGDNPLYQQFLR